MTDDMVDGGRAGTVRLPSDRLVATACFGVACAIGLVFAFVGLDTHSLWFDELFTARLLEPMPGTNLLGRIVTDVHPPLYLLMLAGFTALFGEGDAALRLFSAIAACGAVLVFVTGMRTTFTLPARLFGAALATGSLFWFNQAQNARSYALCLLIVSCVLALGLKLLREREPRHRRTLLVLLTLMLAGTFVHFYVLYVGLAVLIMLGLFARRDRLVLGAAAIGLVLAAGLYVKLVIEPHTQVSLGENWYQNNAAWYVSVLKSCLLYTLGTPGLMAMLLCAVAILYGRRASGPAALQPDRATVFLAGVPVLVLGGAIVSSTLLAPNFWDRNFLVVSPFFWALAARCYDAALAKAGPALRRLLAAALGIIVLSMSSVVMARLPSGEARVLYEPFRQSAHWIRTLPACRGQILPVVTTDRAAWYKPGYGELIYGSAYGRYLEDFAPTTLVFSGDLAQGVLPPGLKAELQRRLAGEGCPVLVWTVHNMEPKAIDWIRDKLLATLDRRDAAARITIREFEDGALGYVLTVRH